MVEIETPAINDYPELFENGKKLIVELNKEFKSEIDKILNSRREWLNLRKSIKDKGSFPKFDEKFIDADGNVLTFREIIQGLIDNFLGLNTKLRWCLNSKVPIPDDAHPLKNPGLEITGPWYPLSRAIHQINSDVAVAFEDEEDASPPWYVPFGSENKLPLVWEGRRNVKKVLSGSIPTPYYEKGKSYNINKPRDKWPTVFHRVPGIHLLDFYTKVDGKPVPSIIVSIVIYAINNYESLKKANSGIYFYIPKVQTPDEALLIEKILRRVEDHLKLKYGSIKIAMLYEEGRAGLYLPVILWIWRERLIKSSNGRWDYLGSLIEMWKDEKVFPDPQTITMTSPNMMVYQRYNALMMLMAGICDGKLNGAPVGGMAAVMLYPKTDPYKRYRYNYKALRDIKLDKLRERLIGLIFLLEDEKAKKDITLEDILNNKVKGKLYDVFRQSWVATKEESYVKAGNEPLRVSLEDLQALIDKKVELVEVDGKLLPTVDSGLTDDEKKRFQRLGLLNKDGKITPWVITKDMIDSPDKIFSPDLWGGKDLWSSLYDVPEGDITIEHIQHAFYMAANYGFQILNGNLAAAIDDYELNQRFMNDLATYRIFVSWLWTLLKHEAVITKDGYLKRPKLTENGVIPALDSLKVKAGTKFDKYLFEKLCEFHYEWTLEFYKEYDRISAIRILEKLSKPKDDEMVKKVSEILSKAYNSGPFKEFSLEDASKEIAKIIGSKVEDVKEEVRNNAPRFDRSKAPIIMEVLKKQLTSPRYIQHSARLLFVIAEADENGRKQILEAVFSSSRDEVVSKIKENKLDEVMLDIHDYIYDYRY